MSDSDISDLARMLPCRTPETSRRAAVAAAAVAVGVNVLLPAARSSASHPASGPAAQL